jgi:hypothetical protein
MYGLMEKGGLPPAQERMGGKFSSNGDLKFFKNMIDEKSIQKITR